MTKRTKKLSLNKETVLDLQANALSNVRGGVVMAVGTQRTCVKIGKILNADSQLPYIAHQF